MLFTFWRNYRAFVCVCVSVLLLLLNSVIIFEHEIIVKLKLPISNETNKKKESLQSPKMKSEHNTNYTGIHWMISA